jgi:CheY-like chemotaxis protein
MTIIIIDDDEDDRLFFIEATKAYDETINLVAVDKAQDALRYLNNVTNALPDFIFLDLRMPA